MKNVLSLLQGQYFRILMKGGVNTQSNTELLGRYDIISVLKEDDRSIVYLAAHKKMGNKRIIKIISKKSIYIESFKAEFHILKDLKHRFIPQIYDIEEDEGSFYIIEEYIEGESLKVLIERVGPYSEEDTIFYIKNLTDILVFLQSYEGGAIYHQDIQPTNIIIDKKELYLIDFGNSFSTGNEFIRSSIFGTEGFTPPERYISDYKENISICERADIYSLGCIIYYFLTGNIIESDQYIEMLNKLNISDGFKKLIKSMLKEEPDLRISGIGIVKKELEKLMEFKERDMDSLITRPYVISVVGTQARIGTTEIALAITKFINKYSLDVLYEENNNNFFVNELHKDGKAYFREGMYNYNGIKLKPKYNDNIRIDYKTSYIVRDESVIKEGLEYGDLIILIAGTKSQEMPYTNRAIDILRGLYEEDIYKDVMIIFNLSKEDLFKERREVIGSNFKLYRIAYMDSSEKEFLTEEIKEEIYFKVFRREKENNKTELSKKRTKNKSYWNSFWKKRRG